MQNMNNGPQANYRQSYRARRRIARNAPQALTLPPEQEGYYRLLRRELLLKRISQLLLIGYGFLTMIGMIAFDLNRGADFVRPSIITIWFFLGAAIGGFCTWAITECMEHSTWEEERRLNLARIIAGIAAGLCVTLDLLLWAEVFNGQPGLLLACTFVALVLFGVTLIILLATRLNLVRRDLADLEFGAAQQQPQPPAQA